MKTITLEELQTAIKETSNNKAAGPSGLTYECWKYASKEVHKALQEIFDRIISHKKMPSGWKKTNTILIPKPKNWNKNVDITRPIVLIETARKIFTKILTNRIEKACRTNNILRGNNCSVLRGTSTHVPINILTNIIEDAKTEHNKEAWLILQDMKKAYDSVRWFGLLKSLRRIKMNEDYIDLLRDLYTTR